MIVKSQSNETNQKPKSATTTIREGKGEGGGGGVKKQQKKQLTEWSSEC